MKHYEIMGGDFYRDKGYKTRKILSSMFFVIACFIPLLAIAVFLYGFGLSDFTYIRNGLIKTTALGGELMACSPIILICGAVSLYISRLLKSM